MVLPKCLLAVRRENALSGELRLREYAGRLLLSNRILNPSLPRHHLAQARFDNAADREKTIQSMDAGKGEDAGQTTTNSLFLIAEWQNPLRTPRHKGHQEIWDCETE